MKMESLSSNSLINLDSFTKSNFSPDILKRNTIEKSDVVNRPEPDILQVSSIVDEFERVNKELPKPSASGVHNTNPNTYNLVDSTVFNDGFFTILTNPRTLDFLVNLGDYKQQEDRKPSFHRKFQEHLKPFSSSGMKNTANKKLNSGAKNLGISNQFTNYILEDDVSETSATVGNNQPKNLISISVDEVADLFATKLSSQERAILHTKSMKKELYELRKLLLSKNYLYNKSLEERRNKIQDLQVLLKKSNEEQKESEKMCLSFTEKLEQYEFIQKGCEELIVKVAKTTEESKSIFEEWKTTVTKDIADFKKFFADTQESYIKLEEKYNKLSEQINLELKVKADLKDRYEQVIFDLEDTEKNYSQLKANAEMQLKDVNLEHTGIELSQQQEVHKLQLDIKKKQCNISALEEDFETKTKETNSIKKLCEEFLNNIQ